MEFAAELGSSFRPKRLRVLCAEDHGQMAELIQQVLERAGHDVTCVADGREAWERIMENPFMFDAIVTDHQMPYLTGLELVRKLRAIGFDRKIIVQSSGLTAQEEAAFRRLGVDAILGKPAGVFELAKRIS